MKGSVENSHEVKDKLFDDTLSPQSDYGLEVVSCGFALMAKLYLKLSK